MNKPDFGMLEHTIGYTFHNRDLLIQALRHSSYTNEHGLSKVENNERPEFLGDAVLELVSSSFLYEKYPDELEGKLTRERARLVCEPALAYSASLIDLSRFLLLGKGEEKTGGRNRDSVISNAFEALIGAIYLDGGFEPAKTFIHRFVLAHAEERMMFYDAKTVLQELLQGKGKGSPVYQLLEESGPDHEKLFRFGVYVGETLLAEGEGRSKKLAEQNAAYEAIAILEED